jgi:glyoxylate/hydroxypyruvate reductase A
MTLLVAITSWEVPPWVERFRKLLPGRRVVAVGEVFDPAEIRYAATWKHRPGALAGLPNLSAIFSLGAGVDHLLGDPHLPDVPVYRVVDPGLTARMSEYVVLHCLYHLRQMPRYLAQQREGVWFDDRLQPAAADLRVGLMGLGELGRDAAAKLRTLGFRVNGWSRSRQQLDGVTTFAGAAERAAFLAATDILVVLLPLTPETRGIVDRSLLAGLARDGALGGPVLVNAGRGGLQKEADILACLDDGTLKAASLDVFETEPLLPASPLWSHPAVTLTPHNAARSAPDEVGRLVVRQIGRLEAGLPGEHRVERSRGY